MSPLPCGLSRDHRPRYVSGTPRPYAGGRIWIGRFSSLPCARRNGRASASLTARGGGLPIGVSTHSTPNVFHVCHRRIIAFPPLWLSLVTLQEPMAGIVRRYMAEASADLQTSSNR